MRIRLDLAYDGAGFAGWATQPGLRTVQGTLEDGLERVLRERVRLTVAGRTDAGVHATGQVAHFDAAQWFRPFDRLRTPLRSTTNDIDSTAMTCGSDTPISRIGTRPPSTPTETFDLVRRLAGVLPPDVVVRHARVAPAGFDARFSATARRYSYRISDSITTRDPRQRGYVLWVRRPLAVSQMHAAMQPLLGLHDFAAFCKPRPEGTTIRELHRFSVTREGAGLVVANVVADAFCHHMVRSLMGAAIAVGEGRQEVVWPARVLATGERATAVVSAHGLTLEEVYYPPDAELATRAATIRARRELP